MTWQAEQNYRSHVTQKLSDYLSAHKFFVKTNNNSVEIECHRAQVVSALPLQQFYCPVSERTNKDADLLPRLLRKI